MYMLVKIGHFVITTQLSGSPVSYLSQQLGNCLISVKRLFDKFIVSDFNLVPFQSASSSLIFWSSTFVISCSGGGGGVGDVPWNNWKLVNMLGEGRQDEWNGEGVYPSLSLSHHPPHAF